MRKLGEVFAYLRSVWSELEIRRIDRPSFRRYFWLTRKRYSVGSGLQNDILLLDSAISRQAGSLERGERTTRWKPISGSKAFDCQRDVVSVGPYEFRARVLGRAWIVLSALLGCLLLWTGMHGWRSTAESVQSVRSARVQDLPARGAYGVLSKNSPLMDDVTFGFRYDGGGDLLLHYAPGNIHNSEALSIELNDKIVGYASICRGRWGVEERLPLSRERLRLGSNVLRFRHDRGGPDARWGVRDVYVTELPSHIDPSETAQSLFRRARMLFLQRGARSGNLVRAGQLLARAKTKWKLEGVPLPVAAQELFQDIRAEEERQFTQALAEADRAIGLGEREQAREIYGRLLREWVEPTDPRRKAIEKRLEALKP